MAALLPWLSRLGALVPLTGLSSCLLKLFYLISYFGLHWACIAAGGLPLVAASSGYSLFRRAGFSLWWLSLDAEHRF